MSNMHDTYNDEAVDYEQEARYLWEDGRKLANDPDASTISRHLRKIGGLPNVYQADGVDGLPFIYRGI